MQTLKTEWDLYEIIPVKRSQSQARVENATSDRFESFRRASHSEFEMQRRKPKPLN